MRQSPVPSQDYWRFRAQAEISVPSIVHPPGTLLNMCGTVCLCLLEESLLCLPLSQPGVFFLSPISTFSFRPSLEGFSSSFSHPSVEGNAFSLQFTTIFFLAFPLGRQAPLFCHPFATCNSERGDKCNLSFQLWGVLFWCRGQSWGFFPESRVLAIRVRLQAKGSCPGGRGICSQGQGGKTLPRNKELRST